MGHDNPELAEKDPDVLEELIRQTGIPETFASLAAKGTVPWRAEPFIPFHDHRFPTPSGRIEILSAAFLGSGLPAAPAPAADFPASGRKLRLLSPASAWSLNTNYSNDPRIRARARSGSVLLNPAEASDRGLHDGAEVILRSEAGQLKLPVSVSDIVPRGVALVYKGRWPKCEPGQANVNILHPGKRTDFGDSSGVHSVEVEIEPIVLSPPSSARRLSQPFGRAGELRPTPSRAE